MAAERHGAAEFVSMFACLVNWKKKREKAHLLGESDHEFLLDESSVWSVDQPNDDSNWYIYATSVP